MSLKCSQQLIEAGKYLMQHSLAWGNSGNMSARLDETRMLITGSGTYMGSLAETDLVAVEIATGSYDPNQCKPSKEIPMHAAIYESRPEAQYIIHSSPFWSTFAACSDLEIRNELFIESMYYLEHTAYVDYYHPGSVQLGLAVGRAAQNNDVIFLKNHGLIVFDTSMKEARMRIETVEMTCRMLALSQMANVSLHFMDKPIVEHFLNNSGYKPRRKRY